MNTTLIDLFYGSLFHDIGKVVQRSTQQKVRHTKLGSDYLKKFDANQSILNQVNYHHYQELSSSKLATNDLAYITYLADNIASGVDRRENSKPAVRQWDSKANLADVFNKFGSEETQRYFRPVELNLTIDHIFPDEKARQFGSGEYSGILHRIDNTLEQMTFTEEYMQSALNLLEAVMSFIPSSTNMNEVADISLYDHSKLTAGFAAVIYHYLTDQGRSDYRQELLQNSQRFYAEEAFLLVSFDLSGIQDFIYTITSQGAHKQLRSRSFYLDMISEWLIDSLLQACQLTRANLMYGGGGHAYLILPNTAAAQKEITHMERIFNEFFLEYFGTKLFVAFGTTAFAAKDVMQGNTPSLYRSIFQRVSQEISQKKLHRYSAEKIQQLNQKGKRTGRECSVCHTVSHLKEETKCVLCDKLENFSINIQKDDFFEVNAQKDGLPIGPAAYLHKIDLNEIKKRHFSGKIYAKNQLYTGIDQATRLWIADYSYLANNEFSYYAQRKWSEVDDTVPGIKRMGALRCDVDDLGYGFMAGFTQQNSGIYNTLSRTATFSRSMSIFFKLYINQFAKDRRLTIIYAGGDDVFLLGAWDDVIVFAIELRQHFIRWTNGKLTLSSGIGLFPEKTPINLIASVTGELEEAAKDNAKDSIALFSAEYTFAYDTFIEEIYTEKLQKIRQFFAEENERGKAFIYKLLSLIRERDETDRIAFARLAYYLARLEEDTSNRNNFSDFKNQMRDWFEDSEQIKQVEMALMLYIYEMRKD